MIKVISVEPLEDFVLRIGFSDGLVREVDLDPYLRGPVFEPLRRDPAMFRAVRIDPEWGALVWPNGADMDTLVLHGDYEPAWRTSGREPSRS